MNTKLLGLIVSMALIAPAEASSTTYNVNIQAGFSIVGTITTDGTFGPLQDSNIVAYDLAVSGTPDVVCLSACTVNPLDPLGQFNISGGYFATGRGLFATPKELTFDFAATNSNFIILGSNTYPEYFVEFFDHQLISSPEGLPDDEGPGGIGVGGGIGATVGRFVITPNLGNVIENADGSSVIGTTTPVPAALPLFATGLGGLGLLGWRRRRKAQAN